jgi:hypothetical protein
MNAEKIPLRLTGTRPLLMHCSRLSDPLDPITKSLARLTAKRPKTESDHIEIGRIEWYGGLWLHKGLPCIPAEALQSAFKSVAKTEKRGQQAAAGILVEAPAIIKYDGPTNIDELWLDGRFSLRVPARVGRARTIRTRARFPECSPPAFSEIQGQRVGRRLSSGGVGDSIGSYDQRTEHIGAVGNSQHGSPCGRS